MTANPSRSRSSTTVTESDPTARAARRTWPPRVDSDDSTADLRGIEGFLSPRSLGRLSSALYLLCGALVAIGAAVLPGSPGSNRWATEAVAAVALTCGVAIGLLP